MLSLLWLSTIPPMFELFTALMLGILEGITEFLPVSSTGHLLIAEHWLGSRSDFFNIVIQAGAILAITFVFRKKVWSLATGLDKYSNRDYVMKLATAFLITAVVGLAVRKANWQLPETIQPIAWALIIGGIWILIAESVAKHLPERENVTWSVAIAVGLAQVVAGVFPGTSRSASTIFLAMLLGLSKRSAAAEFSFLVGIPTMFSASSYACFELFKRGELLHENWLEVSVAFVAAMLTGFAVVKWLLGYIKNHSFAPFAYYRIALGLVLLTWLT
ncbi:Undecaprenyl-diphosphatase [Xylella fastidiosa M23]|nr:Undecaprenyl-diphosphatase [Xylella fastidiosa M23]